MKIIKKNQLAILVIALMLITAGYLNYDTTYNQTQNIDVGAKIDTSEGVNLAALRRCRTCKCKCNRRTGSNT